MQICTPPQKYTIAKYTTSLQNGSDQLFVTLYTYRYIPLYTNSWSEPFLRDGNYVKLILGLVSFSQNILWTLFVIE